MENAKINIKNKVISFRQEYELKISFRAKKRIEEDIWNRIDLELLWMGGSQNRNLAWVSKGFKIIG